MATVAQECLLVALGESVDLVQLNWSRGSEDRSDRTGIVRLNSHRVVQHCHRRGQRTGCPSSNNRYRSASSSWLSTAKTGHLSSADPESRQISFVVDPADAVPFLKGLAELWMVASSSSKTKW